MSAKITRTPAAGTKARPLCPKCERKLDHVDGPDWMNRDQWDAVKAGSYFVEGCEAAECPGSANGAFGCRYFGEIAS